MISLTTVLCIAIVFLNLNQHDTKTIQKDSDKASNITMTNTNTTNPSLVNKLFDLDGIMHNFFPNLFNGGGNHFDNFQNYPNNGNQVSNPQENNWNNGNWDDRSINYPDSPQNYPGQNVQVNNAQLPGYDFNNVDPNTPQVNNPQYPGRNFNNFDKDNYPVNPNIPQVNNNFQYPGNDFNNLVNGGNNPVNPNIPQEKYPQYPGARSNLNSNNKWNNNRYPGNYDNDPSYPDEQGQYPGSDTSWNTNNGLQNNQNPNLIMFPEVQGVPQAHTPGLYQGPPRDPQGILQDPGLQNGGPFNPQDSNGLNYLPNGNLQKPLLQYPQFTRPVITTSTTEKVAILGLPVSVHYETTQKPSVTTSTSSALKQCVQDCPTTSEYNPVCGSNNVTYFNEAKMECARFCGIDVTAKMNGACTSGPSPGIFG